MVYKIQKKVLKLGPDCLRYGRLCKQKWNEGQPYNERRRLSEVSRFETISKKGGRCRTSLIIGLATYFLGVWKLKTETG